MTANTAKASGLVLDEKPISTVEDEIRRRAYELYDARGGQDGHELEDWLQAKAEISDIQSVRTSLDLRRRSKSAT